MKSLRNVFLTLLLVCCGSFLLASCCGNETYTITVSQNANGTVSVDKTEANEGETITITATPDGGYMVDYYLLDSTRIDSNTITMPAKDITVSAIFREETNEDTGVYSVYVMQNPNGSVSVDKNRAESGEEITITASANDGYSLYAILCNGEIINSNTVTMPNNNIYISAIFQEISDSIPTPLIGTYNTISASSLDGTTLVYEQMFLNTITIKEGNLVDLFIYLSEQPYELENIAFTQNGNIFSASIQGQNFSVTIVDDKTLIYKDDYSLAVFYYQEDVDIPLGSYAASYDEDGDSVSETTYAINFLEDGNAQVAKFIDNELALGVIETTYKLRGNALFVNLGNLFFYARIDTTHFNEAVSSIYFTSAMYVYDTQDWTINQKYDWLNFYKCAALESGTQYNANNAPESYADYQYKFNTIEVGDANTVSLTAHFGFYPNYQYLNLENMPYSQIGNYFIIKVSSQTFIARTNYYNANNIYLYVNSTDYITYEIIDTPYEITNGTYEATDSTNTITLVVNNNNFEVTYTSSSGTIQFNGASKYVGNILIIEGEENTFIGKVAFSSADFMSFDINGCGYFNNSGEFIEFEYDDPTGASNIALDKIA